MSDIPGSDNEETKDGRLDSHDPPLPPNSRPIDDFPVEILLRIFELLAPWPPRTRKNVCTLVKLTHVCRFWREALIEVPLAWATIFATQNDSGSFVETWLERSKDMPLEVTAEACYHEGRNFVCEFLTRPEHSKRIRTFDITFTSWNPSPGKMAPLEPSHQLSELTHYPQLTSLEWVDARSMNPPDFQHSPLLSAPRLRSLSFQGCAWLDKLPNISNLTSFTFAGFSVDEATFRVFLQNNPSLETLSLDKVRFKGDSDQEPVVLSNLKSLTVKWPRSDSFGFYFHVPAFRRLSSLSYSIKLGVNNQDKLHATGKGIALTLESKYDLISEAWRHLTGYVKPTFERVRFENLGLIQYNLSGRLSVLNDLFAGAHTLEISHDCNRLYPYLWGTVLERVMPQLRTIRFELPGNAKGCPGQSTGSVDGCDPQGSGLLDDIEKILGNFKVPWPSVERLVTTSESESVNRKQELVWQRIHNDLLSQCPDAQWAPR